MTGTILAFHVAGSIVALFVFWFLHALKVLRQMSLDVRRAEEQVRLHRDGWENVRGGPEEKAAARMLETSAQIHEQLRDRYRRTLKQPIYRFPGFVMGLSAISRKAHPKGTKGL